MNKLIIVILSLFLCINILSCEEIEFKYSEWVDYYPESISEDRIEMQDRFKWFKIENNNRIETQEYYDELEGYEKIENSKKTFYRVINNEYLIYNPDGVIVKNTDECRKVFCYKVKNEPFIPKEIIEEEPEKPSKPNEEVIINPDTYDPIYTNLSLLIISIFVIFILNYKKINLVLSNRWK